MARAVEQLAEVHVEIAQEGIGAVGIGDGNAEVAAILLRPLVEGEGLRITQARPERLAGLHVLVCHGAERRQVVAHGEPHVGGAGEVFRHLALQSLKNLLVPGKREAPARAEVRDAEVELALDRAHEVDLRLQPPATLIEVRARLRAPEIDL